MVWLILSLYLYLILFDLIEEKKSVKSIKAEEERPEKEDLWSHPLLTMNGIEKPLEHCEVESVSRVDCPLEWRIDWQGENESREYHTIDITNYKLLE